MIRYLILSLAGLMIGLGPVYATPLNPADVLVSWAGYPASYVQEYTRSGVLVQSWTITSTFSSEYARGIVADNSGNIDVYNGTFSPYLTTVNPATGAKTNRNLAGWDTTNVGGQGQVAVIGNYVYASDTNTGADSQAGVVRFDLTNPAAPGVRFDGNEITSLGSGRNGLLYAVWPNSSPGENQLDVLDPATLTVVKTISLPVSLGGVAADANGNIYGTSGATIYKFDSNGNVLTTLNTGIAGLTHIQISTANELVTSDTGGTVVLTNTSFSTLSHFSLNEPNAQMYASSAAFAPEPTVIGPVIVVSLLFTRRRRQMAGDDRAEVRTTPREIRA